MYKGVGCSLFFFFGGGGGGGGMSEPPELHLDQPSDRYM